MAAYTFSLTGTKRPVKVPRQKENGQAGRGTKFHADPSLTFPAEHHSNSPRKNASVKIGKTSQPPSKKPTIFSDSWTSEETTNSGRYPANFVWMTGRKKGWHWSRKNRNRETSSETKSCVGPSPLPATLRKRLSLRISSGSHKKTNFDKMGCNFWTFNQEQWRICRTLDNFATRKTLPMLALAKVDKSWRLPHLKLSQQLLSQRKINTHWS